MRSDYRTIARTVGILLLISLTQGCVATAAKSSRLDEIAGKGLPAGKALVLVRAIGLGKAMQLNFQYDGPEGGRFSGVKPPQYWQPIFVVYGIEGGVPFLGEPFLYEVEAGFICASSVTEGLRSWDAKPAPCSVARADTITYVGDVGIVEGTLRIANHPVTIKEARRKYPQVMERFTLETRLLE
jgi:hypothetical protein